MEFFGPGGSPLLQQGELDFSPAKRSRHKFGFSRGTSPAHIEEHAQLTPGSSYTAPLTSRVLSSRDREKCPKRTIRRGRNREPPANMMKSSNWFSCLAILLFWPVWSAQAQTQLVVQEGVIVSQSLSGHVHIGLEKAAGKGVTVELCSADWKTVLASAKTDDKGYFSVEKPAGNLFHLRFSSTGVNPLLVQVRISKNAGHDLSIHLSIAT